MIFLGLDIKDRNKIKTKAFSEMIVYNFFELKFEYTVNVYILLGCTKVNLRAIKKMLFPLKTNNSWREIVFKMKIITLIS